YGVPPRPPTNLDPNTLAELLKAIREGNGDALAKKLREDRALQEWAKRQVGKIDFDDPKVQEMLRNMVGKFDRAPDLKGSDSAPLVDILKGVQQKLPAERMSEGGPAEDRPGEQRGRPRPAPRRRAGAEDPQTRRRRPRGAGTGRPAHARTRPRLREPAGGTAQLAGAAAGDRERQPLRLQQDPGV